VLAAGLLDRYPTVRRIVFSSGKTSATLFAKMNRAWLRSRPFLVGPTEFSQAVFGRLVTSHTVSLSAGLRLAGVVCQPVNGSGMLSSLVPEKSVYFPASPLSYASERPELRQEGILDPLEKSIGKSRENAQDTSYAPNSRGIASCCSSSQLGSLPQLPMNPDWAASVLAGQELTAEGRSGRLLPPIELIVPLSVSPAGSASQRYLR
jgi:hypothetical protein